MIKGSDIYVARVKMIDYMSEEAANEIEQAYREICTQILSEDDALILVFIEASSGLRIAIYKTEELAEEMLPTRAKMLEQGPCGIQDMFYLEAPLGLHYVNELFQKNRATCYALSC